MHTVPHLGVNIDHIATLRNARGVFYPSPVEGARICEQAGASGITVHLREDRRHIKDADVYALKQSIQTRLNLEMAVTDEMLAIALEVKPTWVCLVPEKRSEVTTEGGLDVAACVGLAECIQALQAQGIQVSLFVDPVESAIVRSIELGANAVELHTGAYAEAFLAGDAAQTTAELLRIQHSVAFAKAQNPALIVNAGHGLTRDNVGAIAAIDGIYELNIGHSIIADAVFVGLFEAVRAMHRAMGAV